MVSWCVNIERFFCNGALSQTIMVVLTSNRFVGDTVYQFVLRVFGTFIGETSHKRM